MAPLHKLRVLFILLERYERIPTTEGDGPFEAPVSAGGVGWQGRGVGLPDVRVVGGEAGGAQEGGEWGGWGSYGRCCCHFVVTLHDGRKKTRENLVTGDGHAM